MSVHFLNEIAAVATLPHNIILFYVIPSEEMMGIYFITLVVGYFAYAQYDVLFIPYRHFVPLPPKEEANYRLCERSEANSREGGGLRSISSALFRWDISLPLNMTYFLSPIGALRHFAYAADAPLLSLSRHFPRFSGGIYPEGGSETTRHSVNVE